MFEGELRLNRRGALKNIGMMIAGGVSIAAGIIDQRAGQAKAIELQKTARTEVEQLLPRPDDEAVRASHRVQNQLRDKSPMDMSRDELHQYIEAVRKIDQNQVFNRELERRADQKIAQEGHSPNRQTLDEGAKIGGAIFATKGLVDLFWPLRRNRIPTEQNPSDKSEQTQPPQEK